ncbi:MAG: hypothetical protein ACI4JC_06340 [Faecalibacterium sp.]
MRSGGWKPFWAALGAALLLFLPLAGGTVLLSRQQARERVRQAAESQSGVAIQLPRTNNHLTALVCIADEVPAFVLLYCNAEQNCIRLLAIPGEVCVSFGGESVPLTRCYAAAGPARCREVLSAAFDLPEDTRYLALSPAALEQVTQGFEPLRVGFSGSLQTEELEQAGLSAEIQQLSVPAAHRMLRGLAEDAGLSPSACGAARAAVWDAFFRQNLELLPSRLPAALRGVSSSLLTDLTAQEYLTLEETLEFLANNSAPVWNAVLPGSWDNDTGLYTPTDASRAAVQTLLNVSPTDAQAWSDSEP